MRLIDADALDADIQTTIENSGLVYHEDEILDCVKYAPTIDAVPVVRCLEKKQDPMKPTYDHRYAEMGCSMCGSMIGGWEEQPNYCPNCGQAIDWSEE